MMGLMNNNFVRFWVPAVTPKVCLQHDADMTSAARPGFRPAALWSKMRHG